MNIIIIYQLKSDESFVAALEDSLTKSKHILHVMKIRDDAKALELIQEINFVNEDLMILISLDANITKLLNHLANKKTIIVLNRNKDLKEHMALGLLANKDFHYILNSELKSSATDTNVIYYDNAVELSSHINRYNPNKGTKSSSERKHINSMAFDVLLYKLKVQWVGFMRRYSKRK